MKTGSVSVTGIRDSDAFTTDICGKQQIMKPQSRIVISLILAIFAFTFIQSARADMVTDWNVIATTAAAAPVKGGILQTRIYAMTHAAVHDALNAIDRRSHPYALDVRVDPDASPEAAVAAAAHDVLVHELPVSQHAFLDAQYASSLSGIPDGAAKQAGIAVGQAAAAAIIAVRIADGADASLSYTPDSGPGEWIPTPPAFLPALEPGWGNVTPFTLRSSAQFRLDPPAYFDLTSEEYTADYNEVKSIGAVNSPSRTAEQSEIAQFWYEASAQGWNRLTRIVSAQQALDLWENARLFGLVNFALADGYIAHFDTKYLYNFWRPITAIRAGDTDGNPDTVADPAWTSFLVTPNIPDYPSGHSTVGAAAAAIVLARFFGDDEIPSTSTSGAPFPGITRSFTSFSQAAQENADSRVFVGIYFRTACRDGVRLGKQVGRFVFNHFLKRVKPVKQGWHECYGSCYLLLCQAAARGSLAGGT
jgi:hypothetical protein